MDPIMKHPEYIRAKEHLMALGLKWEWLTHTVDTAGPAAFFFPNGKRGYHSECPYYEGFWLCGGFGGSKCNLSEAPRPVIYYEAVCTKKYEDCPHWKPVGMTQEQPNGKVK